MGQKQFFQSKSSETDFFFFFFLETDIAGNFLKIVQVGMFLLSLSIFTYAFKANMHWLISVECSRARGSTASQGMGGQLLGIHFL